MDDRSAAGPDEMPVPHLKMLARPRKSDTRQDSGISALHDCVCLMAEGCVSEAAANFYSREILLACSKPNGKYRPNAIGTVSRRLVSCFLLKTSFT